MTIRVVPKRVLACSYLLSVFKDPVQQRTMTKRPSAATEGGSQFTLLINGFTVE